MKKQWKLKLACPRGEKEDTKEIVVEAKNEKGALSKLGNLPSNELHCVHGPLIVIELVETTEKVLVDLN